MCIERGVSRDNSKLSVSAICGELETELESDEENGKQPNPQHRMTNNMSNKVCLQSNETEINLVDDYAWQPLPDNEHAETDGVSNSIRKKVRSIEKSMKKYELYSQ